MRKLASRFTIGTLLSFAAASCGGTDPSSSTPETEPSQTSPEVYTGALDQDLGQGSQGASVRAVQAYLTQFGYFPNDELARSYPAWRAIVTHSPDPGVFDDY